MKQIALPLGTRPAPSFDAFVPGENRLALQQVQALAADADPAAVPCCYLWGASGTGKTHLLRSLAAACRQRGAAVSWFSADDAAPWPALPPADAGDPPAPSLIVLDGCDDLDAAQQHAAFALFVEAAARRRCPVAAAGRVPPVDLPLREDLRTRLGWGHVLALVPLTEADTRTALHAAARARGLSLADDVSTYLLTHFARDLKHLVALLDRLDDFALASRRAAGLAMLKQMLAEEAAAATTTP